ncbi:hypothetical protein B0H10DRAFT_1937543 [Mycena sp. CBHHK59/15]|nr:hypothetical protein B0H10DRAFT_1937543 [Mycena sp. CBHHK59/15]
MTECDSALGLCYHDDTSLYALNFRCSKMVIQDIKLPATTWLRSTRKSGLGQLKSAHDMAVLLGSYQEERQRDNAERRDDGMAVGELQDERKTWEGGMTGWRLGADCNTESTFLTGSYGSREGEGGLCEHRGRLHSELGRQWTVRLAQVCI